MSERENNVIASIQTALSEYGSLKNKEYAPIYNSHIMLNEMGEYYERGVRNISEEQIGQINVGLLAAKALDFHDVFTDYANKLHNAWYSFIAFLVNSPSNYHNVIPSSGPIKQTYDFYKDHGFDDAKAKNHMQGIDFSRAIDDNFTLSSGNNVAQWKNRNIVKNGNYYTDVGNTPNCLGIYFKQEDEQGNLGVREEHIFLLQQSVVCLKSYAADAHDRWSIKNQIFHVRGGCIQYFNEKNKGDFQKISP